MALSQDQVEWAYRLILGREPESDEALDNHRRAGSLDELVRRFMGSQEFAHRGIAVADVESFQMASAIDVQVACTPEELEAMLARIAEAWRAFGDSQPHWSVVTHPDFTADKIEDNLEAFYATGPGTVDWVKAILTRNGIDPGRVTKVLDYGCGVGRLSLAFGAAFPHVTGIDVSPPHVELARRRAADTGSTNVEFTAISRLADLDDLEGYDLVITFIVLQHNPPPIIAATLERLLDALAPGGVAVFQVPTYIDTYRFDVADYLANDQPQMEMNFLPQRDVFRIIAERGCDPLEVREDRMVGPLAGVSQTFVARKH